MEDSDVPLEQVHEDLHHHAKQSERWTLGVALTTALLAGLAAITALFSGHHANEGMLEQILASDQWSYYQAKGIKAAVLNAKIELLTGLGKIADEKDRAKAADYKREQEETSRLAKEKEASSKAHMGLHVIYARGVTLFQVAIAVSAISVLTRRRAFWFVGIAFGCVGVVFLAQGLIVDLRV
jgi:Domain of unknown function (DUF4337)